MISDLVLLQFQYIIVQLTSLVYTYYGPILAFQLPSASNVSIYTNPNAPILTGALTMSGNKPIIFARVNQSNT